VFDQTGAADLANAVASLVRAVGEPDDTKTHLVNAGISTIAAIPFVGDFAKLGKYGQRLKPHQKTFQAAGKAVQALYRKPSSQGERRRRRESGEEWDEPSLGEQAQGAATRLLSSPYAIKNIGTAIAVSVQAAAGRGSGPPALPGAPPTGASGSTLSGLLSALGARLGNMAGTAGGGVKAGTQAAATLAAAHPIKTATIATGTTAGGFLAFMGYRRRKLRRREEEAQRRQALVIQQAAQADAAAATIPVRPVPVVPRATDYYREAWRPPMPSSDTGQADPTFAGRPPLAPQVAPSFAYRTRPIYSSPHGPYGDKGQMNVRKPSRMRSAIRRVKSFPGEYARTAWKISKTRRALRLGAFTMGMGARITSFPARFAARQAARTPHRMARMGMFGPVITEMAGGHYLGPRNLMRQTGRFAGVMVRAGTALTAFTQALRLSTDALKAIQAPYVPYSGVMMAAYVRYRGQEIRRMQQMGQLTGGSYSSMVEAKSRLEDTVTPYRALGTNVSNKIAEWTMEFTNLVIRLIEAVSPIDEIRDSINAWLGGRGAGRVPPHIQVLRDIQAGQFIAPPPRPGRPPRP
jgi:hypothetical protein